MSPHAVLLRVLLCLTLILNGSVPVVHGAMARAHPVPAKDHASSMAMNHDTTDARAGGCHDSAPGDPASSIATADSTRPADAGDDGDCCGDDGGCSSTCAQHCAVSIPGVPLLHLALAPAAGPLPMTVPAQPDPRLRDRIRPPIA